MEEFENKMPHDYYGTKVVEKFSEHDLDKIDYETQFYFRNPKIKYKLSLDHKEVIEFFIRLLKPKNFIEIGTQFGETTNQIIHLIPGDYYAVDIFIHDNMRFLSNKFQNLKLFQNSSDDFFSSQFDGKMFEMAFIDASHNYEDTFRDFMNVKDFIVPDGIIFFHDTYPANLDETHPDLSGDCYKLPEKIRLDYNMEFEIITLPVSPGLSIARKIKRNIGDE
jgi:hypothetical protein